MKRFLQLFFIVALSAATVHAQNLSFVTCPVVRDTKTAPCWLAEYAGETYYLGKQGGVAQDFYPPQLNHEVLVEGVVVAGPRVCGGVPLQPVKTSVLLEIHRACNTILPVEDGIEAPAAAPSRDPISWVRSDSPSQVTLYFDFDNDFLSLHTTGAIQRIAEQFLRTKASAIELSSFRGSSKLSNGKELVEQSGIAGLRASKVQEILVGLGVPQAAVKLRVNAGYRKPDGREDPWSRKVTLSIKP